MPHFTLNLEENKRKRKTRYPLRVKRIYGELIDYQNIDKKYLKKNNNP
jgi:hypothetical protein